MGIDNILTQLLGSMPQQMDQTPLPQPLPEDLIASADPNKTNSPDQRLEGYRRLLTNFTYSLGSGLEAASQNPRGRAQRTQAGMGAILKVPMELEKAREAAKAQKALEQQRLAAAQSSEANAAKTNLLMKAQLDAILAGTQKTNAQTADIPVKSGIAQQNADTAANRGKYMSSPQGLVDISGPVPKVVPGSGPTEFKVSKEVAENFGVPELEGATVPTSTFNQLIKGNDPKRQITTMEEAPGKNGLYIVNLETGEKQRVGDAKSDLLSAAAEAQKLRIAKAAADNRQPELGSDDVQWIADQVDEDSTGTMMSKLVGNNQATRRQVISELRRRDADLHILTASTRQLGETAHELMPNFNHALDLVNDRGVQQAMGPLGSRWQEFLAGRIGTSDPAFRGIAPDTIQKMNDLRTFVSLLQTGTARAHVGARGSEGLREKFEKMFNTDKMDAATLKDTLSSTRDFLKTYENAVYGAGNSSPVREQRSPSTGKYRYTTDNGVTWHEGRAPAR